MASLTGDNFSAGFEVYIHMDTHGYYLFPK